MNARKQGGAGGSVLTYATDGNDAADAAVAASTKKRTDGNDEADQAVAASTKKEPTATTQLTKQSPLRKKGGLYVTLIPGDPSLGSTHIAYSACLAPSDEIEQYLARILHLCVHEIQAWISLWRVFF